MNIIHTRHFIKNIIERICDEDFQADVRKDIEKRFTKGEYLEIPDGHSEKFQNDTYRGVMSIGNHITVKYARDGDNIILISVWPSKDWEKRSFKEEKK